MSKSNNSGTSDFVLDAQKETETAFPFSLADEVFQLLKERDLQCVRYCDLDYKNSRLGSRFRYVDEFVRATEGRFTPFKTLLCLFRLVAIRKGEGRKAMEPLLRFLCRNRPRPIAILQHDADMFPDRTLDMMEKEKKHGLVSSSYFFRDHADPVPYELDLQRMKGLEADGFEMGYHQNAYERSGYELNQALKLVEEDVAFYREHFNLRSFVPHGGTPGPKGINNNSLPQRDSLKPLLWAYNGKCILKHYTWSDGAMKKRAPSDPREFVKNLRPGTRAMFLMHPQYYGHRLRHDWRDLPISSHAWWRKLWNL